MKAHGPNDDGLTTALQCGIAAIVAACGAFFVALANRSSPLSSRGIDLGVVELIAMIASIGLAACGCVFTIDRVPPARQRNRWYGAVLLNTAVLGCWVYAFVATYLA